MKSLVTGASGFVGSTLVDQLLKKGQSVRALIRKTSSTKNLLGAECEKVIGDVLDKASMKEAVKGVDVIYHCAGKVVSQKIESFFQFNTVGTRNLLEAIEEENPKIKKLVLVSSQSASGPSSRVPRTEAMDPKPVSAYGKSKLEAEMATLAYKDKFPVVIVRPPMVYGPRDPEVFAFVKAANGGLVPYVPGRSPTGDKFYSAVYSEDLCAGMILAAEKKVSSGEVFFLTDGGTYTYHEIISSISKCLGKKPFVFPTPEPIIFLASRFLNSFGLMINKEFSLTSDKYNELTPDYWTCSNQKARDILGFVPKYDFNAGMEKTVAWYREHKWI